MGGDVTANPSFGRMEAALAWGLSPDAWYQRPVWARAVMVATVRARRKLDGLAVRDAGKKK